MNRNKYGSTKTMGSFTVLLELGRKKKKGERIRQKEIESK